jgi:hypothetical protein
MGRTINRRETLERMAGAGLALACFGTATFADDPPLQTITARGITFAVPKSWQSSTPRSQMRLTQLKIEPVAGESDPAELVLFAFPGGAGTVEANLQRWSEQFTDDSGRPAKIESAKRPGKNIEVMFAEASGRYVAAVAPGSAERFDKPGYRLLGAIVTTDEVGYFFKMVGPDKTMKAAKPAFEAMIRSIEVEKP